MLKPTGYIVGVNTSASYRGVTAKIEMTIDSLMGAAPEAFKGGDAYVLTKNELIKLLQAAVNKARMGIPLDFEEERKYKYNKYRDRAYYGSSAYAVALDDIDIYKKYYANPCAELPLPPMWSYGVGVDYTGVRANAVAPNPVA